MQTKFTQKNYFFGIAPPAVFLLLVFLALHFIWALQWPILNDESYYWDWSRSMQLSYVDAPPAIAWVSYISSHLAWGNLGARFLVPILYLFSTIFLIKSTQIFCLSRLRTFTVQSSLIVIILFNCIPIFNIYGILLQPDSPLFFASTGALYFALKSCKDFILNKHCHLSLSHSGFLGLFLGLSVASKYQAVFLAIGIFLAIIYLRGIKKTIKNDSLFWFITILTALIVSSPLFIWNIQNNFASFRFQGQHGFSAWHLNVTKFVTYILATIGIILPWYFYLFFKQIILSLKSKYFARSLDVISLFSFFAIFIFIALSALGKPAKIHWITPSFLFLIPLVAMNWEMLTQKHRNFWKTVNLTSGILVIILFSATFTPLFQNFLGKNKTTVSNFTKKIQRGIFSGIIWGGIENPENVIQINAPQIALAEKKYFSHLNELNRNNDVCIASFNWRWASQLAFHMKNNPRVFALNLSRSSYYVWRDPLPLMAACHVLLIGERSMYNEEKLGRLMTIESVHEFTAFRSYSNETINMVFVNGIMKDENTLGELSSYIMQNVHY